MLILVANDFLVSIIDCLYRKERLSDYRINLKILIFDLEYGIIYPIQSSGGIFVLFKQCYDDGKEYGEETKDAIYIIQEHTDVSQWYDLIKDVEYANKLEDLYHKSIRNGIVNRLKELEINIDETEFNAIWKETEKLYKKSGIEPEPVRKVICNWIRNGKVSYKRDNRINMYNLCFALGLDIKQTEEFFDKRFFTIAFNYKDGIDAVYYYCIKNKKSYDCVKELLNIVKNNNVQSGDNYNTTFIKRQIDEIDDDDEFIDYLKSNCFSEEMQMQTARRIIHSIYEELGFKSVSKFLAELYGYNIQSTARKSKMKTGKSIGISKGRLPKSFTKSLPNDTQMAQILDYQKATYESLRKAIILLIFYSFYISHDSMEALNATTPKIEEDLEDFIKETDVKLIEAGYKPMYVKHPFDWIILFCAYTPNPLATFREFIDRGYYDDINDF